MALFYQPDSRYLGVAQGEKYGNSKCCIHIFETKDDTYGTGNLKKDVILDYLQDGTDKNSENVAFLNLEFGEVMVERNTLNFVTLNFVVGCSVSVDRLSLSILQIKRTDYSHYSPLSHGGHIVPGDQKSFVLPRQASPQGFHCEAWCGKTKLFWSPGTIWPPCDKGEFLHSLLLSIEVLHGSHVAWQEQ